MSRKAHEDDRATHGHSHPHHEHVHAHEDPSHPNAHAHTHDHAPHEHAALERDDLPERAGEGKILFFDAPSGIAGDMTIASLVDLGVPREVILQNVEALGLRGFHVHFGHTHRSGIVATLFDVHVESEQPERTYKEVRALIEASTIAPQVKRRALATFQRLAEAEASVHRAPIDDVHFHEVGAVDALVDIVGSAAALEYLGAEVWVSPLPMGHGRVRARHGILPLPAPATVACLRGLQTYDGGLAFEFVTPTGAAIVGAHARSVRWPSFVPERIGWGSGHADLEDRPNLLRSVLGIATDADARVADSHVVLECNLDDATGELVAATIETLLRAQALDAWATPITMKKGRPAVTLSALARCADADRIATVLLTETTSLGVRRYSVSRLERPREIIEVATPWGTVPVKVARGPFGPSHTKPEFDTCARIAREHGVPVREVLRVVLECASALVG